ncbi:MAG: hypothetical protein PHR35_20595, partial [Kiritimatiellae bacterium]|nr:hypothetical protein [Kiritimatiellia bacterium]
MKKMQFSVLAWAGEPGKAVDVRDLVEGTAANPVYRGEDMGERLVVMGWSGPKGWADYLPPFTEQEGWGVLAEDVRAVKLIVTRREAPKTLVQARLDEIEREEPRPRSKSERKEQLAILRDALDHLALPNPTAYLIWQVGRYIGIEGSDKVVQAVHHRMAQRWPAEVVKAWGKTQLMAREDELTAAAWAWCHGADMGEFGLGGGKIEIAPEDESGEPDMLALTGRRARER